jgi:transcription antitermination factor NusG
MEKEWYAIYTMPRAERKVDERFLKQGVETYLPLLTSMRIWSDRKKKIKTPLIPGYIFIKADKKMLTEIYRIDGALGVVKYLGVPAKIKPSELDMIRILIKEPESFNAIKNIDVQLGENFEIHFGTFAGLKGKYIRHAGKYRAIISLESINKMFEVNVPISFLQKI